METKPKGKIRHFSSILYVEDRKTVLDYYNNLGFWCDYNMGFAEREGLSLIFHETNNKDHITSNFPIHGEIALDVFAMVENIDALYEDFKTRGARIHYELKSNNYNMREFAIIDPQGYTIGFGESLV
jgi:uncharacterized glyoxalase superfamily protein PhnB